MEVLVLKTIDSNSLGRIVKPGEIVDLPIEEGDTLLKNRVVVHPNDQLTDRELELVEKSVAEAPSRPAPSTLLTDNDLRVEEEDDGTN
jgi:hypothetical protein